MRNPPRALRAVSGQSAGPAPELKDGRVAGVVPRELGIIQEQDLCEVYKLARSLAKLGCGKCGECGECERTG